MLKSLDLLLLTVSDRKCVGFSLILLCENRFGFVSELAKSKKSIIGSNRRMNTVPKPLGMEVVYFRRHNVSATVYTSIGFEITDSRTSYQHDDNDLESPLHRFAATNQQSISALP